LQHAYDAPSGVVVEDGVEYISGTRGLGDWEKDAVAVLTNRPDLYPHYREARNELIRRHPVRLVGHSAGGSVAGALSSDFGIPAVAYNAPQLFGAKGLSHTGDIVSALTKSQKFGILYDPISAHNWPLRPTDAHGPFLE